TRRRDGPHIRCLIKQGKPEPFDCLCQLSDAHVKPYIRLIGAVETHGLVIRDSREGPLKHKSLYLKEEMACQSLKHVQYIILVDVRHLAVYLSEFRLTVSTQVLI